MHFSIRNRITDKVMMMMITYEHCLQKQNEKIFPPKISVVTKVKYQIISLSVMIMHVCRKKIHKGYCVHCKCGFTS